MTNKDFFFALEIMGYESMEDCPLSEERVENVAKTIATIVQERDELSSHMERIKRELREHAPRVFPMQCFLCEEQMDSPDDYEWHGLGNCVALCEACYGNGFIDAALKQPKEKQ